MPNKPLYEYSPHDPNHRIDRVEQALFGNDENMGAIHQIGVVGDSLRKHVDDCAKKHEAKAADDRWWYRLILSAIVTAMVGGLISALMIGIKVWATKS